MKIAIVVQRYGAEINGGAELHARYVAEHLAPHVQVEVLTTCATDYITWRNALPPGDHAVNGVRVRRFPVSRERDPLEFGRASDLVFKQPHSERDELEWLEIEGPTSPTLINFIKQQQHDYDFFIFFSFRYYHAFHGARAVPSKALLVPTAERDGALGLSMFGPIFRGVRALMYNSFEERAQINAVARNEDVPGVVVGIGSEIPEQVGPSRFRHKFNLRERFAIYVGRIDENKGCGELFDFFIRYSRLFAEGMHLVLIGNPVMPIPEHPKIHHLGFVGDQDKFDAIAASDVLIMPSYLESLSMVALEAWALGKPVLANGRCDVLRGQCIRSNGGLYYESFEEFVETLRAIDLGPSLAASLGRSGREYFRRHYAWPVIEQKYLDMLERLSKEPPVRSMEPLGGWLAARKSDKPPSEEVVARLPAGPALKGGARADTTPPAAAAAPPSAAPPVGMPESRPQPAAAAAPPAPQPNERPWRPQPPRGRPSRPADQAARDSRVPSDPLRVEGRSGKPADSRDQRSGGHRRRRNVSRGRPPRRSNDR